VAGRRERRRKEVLDDLKEKREYWKLKEEVLDRIVWRTGFGKVKVIPLQARCGPEGG